MFPTKTCRVESPAAGQAVTRHLEGTIVETVYAGYCSTELVQSVADHVPEVLTAVKGARWLVDMSRATSSAAGARVPGQTILRTFREMGGAEFAVVIKSSPLRMIFTAVAFGAGLPVKFFDGYPAALRFLRAGAPPA